MSRVILGTITALGLLASAGNAQATDTLNDTWQLQTQTVATVYVGTASVGTSDRISGTEFITFNDDKSVTGSDWVLSGYLNGIDDASYDTSSGKYFPTSEAHKPAVETWKATGSRYQVKFELPALRSNYFYLPTGAASYARAALSESWIDRMAIPVLGDFSIDNTANPIKRPYVYSYTHQGRLSPDKASISGRISVIAIDPILQRSGQRVVYMTTTYTGTRFPVTSTCCVLGSDNADASAAYLTAIDAVPGVQKTASNLRYAVLQEGNGPLLTTSDSVIIAYRGFFPSGATFDSGVLSVAKVGTGLIAGWNEGLQLMKRNAKFRFFIPPELAYGATGNAKIGKNAALVFDVEVLNP